MSKFSCRGRRDGVRSQGQVRPRRGEGSKSGPKTGKSPEFTKGSNLGHEKQSIDLRYFQAGPGERKAESTLVRWHLHPQVPSAHRAWLTCMGADDATAPYSPLWREMLVVQSLNCVRLCDPMHWVASKALCVWVPHPSSSSTLTFLRISAQSQAFTSPSPALSRCLNS